MNFQNTAGTQKFSGGYFGKLPEYTDFVKFNSGGPEILLLDRWIQEGIIYTKKYFSHSSQINTNRNVFQNNFFSINFFSPFTGSGSNLIGTIYPSHDKSGREFPFIIFMNIAKNYTDIPSHLLYPFFSHLYEYFNEMFNEREKGNLSGLNHNISGFHSPDSDISISAGNLLNSYKVFLENTDQKEFRESVLNDTDGSVLLNLLNNLKGGLSFLRSKTDVSVSFGVKISFNRVKEYKNFESAFLLHAVLSAAGKTSLAPAIFLKQEESLAHLFIFLCSPLPHHFMELISGKHNDERILDANKSSGEIPGHPGLVPDTGESKLIFLIDKLSHK